MPRYFTFVRGAENQGVPPKALMDAMETFIGQSLQNGSLVQTGGLKLSPQGARIRVGKGKLTVTDGPFAESKEVIGGYAILEAPSRQKVMEVARAFMQLHVDHWPEWEGESEIREIDFLAP
ncbi:MAG TPA: YciI family protein [Gemmatimonadales bacterium]|jgi:hypothetical protein|nr:YciI family protein [Gemmatimonadales bacterium]